MAIALADLLDENDVTLQLRSRKPANAVREIIQLLTNNGKIDNAGKFLEQVLLREQAHPSVVEYTVAFPHARTDLVDQIVKKVLQLNSNPQAVEGEQDGESPVS